MQKLLAIIFSFLNIILGPKDKIAPKFVAVAPTPTPVSCPEGYILVPRNSEFKTNDFCVMKYDAKCSNFDPKCVTSEGVYKNNDPKCTCERGFKVESRAGGAPITFIPEDGGTGTTAKKYCNDINAHLITNPEWMTIARNVEQIKENWCDKNGTNCGNVPGTPGKILVNGHNDSVPNKALEAGSDNEPCFGTTNNSNGICGTKSSQKRTFTLSNGQIIWDFAGNIWQWVDIVIPLKDEPVSNKNPNSHWTWEEFQSINYDPYNMPSNSNWNSQQGVGRVYHYSQSGNTDSTLYTFIRGGNWRHGYDSGAFTYHEQPVPDKKGIDDVGFRCVTSPRN